ncbi:short-chain dehydrogenase/reductase-like protein [Hypoxylon sp. EC38]|nr:short-chain dehydrogenase/reductase-like protein [Hypoxylon sp. EC38]
MSKPWILVSPASRGIGHALTRHLLRSTTAPVLATARSDLSGVRASILDSLTSPPLLEEEISRRLHTTQVDVTNESTLQSASAEAAKLFPTTTHHLHLAFALPGILHPEKSPCDINYENALRTLQVNVLGPLMLMKYFSDFLPRKGAANSSLFPNHATWLTASARVGSTSDNRLGGWYTYRASKAAVNSLTKTFDLHLKVRSAENAVAMAYHPGTVRTGLSKEYWGRVREDKLFSPEYAAERMVEVVRTRTVGDRGKCWDWKGEDVLP